VDEAGGEVGVDESGELLVRSNAVFKEYWGRAELTAEAFDDGWFRTGDVVDRDAAGCVKVLGRASVDIIKTGGEKISALEVEEVFRAHEAISDCAVVGTEDDQWGERVCMALVASDRVAEPDLRAWGKDRLAAYKVPRSFVLVPHLPRNAMGKVVKSEVAELFDPD
jgi:malonyl-CoA/methylmalonyl-CoA synthetase